MTEKCICITVFIDLRYEQLFEERLGFFNRCTNI